jgi:hypothetical protein
MKIENRLSTLTNKIKENLSLLGDGCSLLTLVNNENFINLRREILLLGSVRESIMTPSETSSEKNYFVRCDDPSFHFSAVAMKIVYVNQ